MGFKDRLKDALLSGAKACGVFGLSSRLTGDRLRILCYHGASYENEHLLSPGTFMRPETFRARMRLLRDWGAAVLPLDDALVRLREQTLPKKAVVITIDDGWYGTYDAMLPVLEDFGFPATIYVSTYYVEKQTFVFNLIVDYILAQARLDRLDLGRLDERLSGEIDVGSRDQRRRAAGRLVEFGESNLDAAGRDELCARLAAVCDYDIDRAREGRLFKFMNAAEVAELPGRGFDVQLHTHRHRFAPDDRTAAVREIDDNLRSLAEMGIPSATHFCYPSGEHAAEHAAWLRDAGVDSAVTTDFGLATATSSAYYLPRICDSDAMGRLDFEGALSGFKDLVRF